MRNKRNKQKADVVLNRGDIALILDALTSYSNEKVELMSQEANKLEGKEYAEGHELNSLMRASFLASRASELILTLVEYLPESEDKIHVIKQAKANIKNHRVGIELFLGLDPDEASESHEWN
jgi:uncharacterized protein (DUF111 family)